MRASRAIATEHVEQTSLFSWARLQERREPALRLLYAVPNGAALVAKTVRRADGKSARYSLEAMKLRAEGLKPGVPDVCLPVARGAFHGLYIEMKRERGGVLSDQQKQWILDLTDEGYCALCCAGWDAARTAITTYLSGQDPR